MNTSTNVQITVTRTITAPGRGVLATGHVDGGIVHVGDILQVHNHHPGATARVGQISQGSKMVKEAKSGEEALLLLEYLTEEAVHLGDRLLPGDEENIPQKDIPQPEEEIWEKLPERIQPILHFGQFAGKIALLAFLSIFWVVPVFIIISIINSPDAPVLVVLGFLAFWFAIVGYITYGRVKDFVNGLRGRNRFLQGQSQTVAQILRRKAQLHEGKYNDYYTFHLQMEFTPTLAAVSVGTLQLEAEVSKKLYERLWEAKTVNISYAVEDPHIFIIEGE